jgi:hypothetical protein
MTQEEKDLLLKDLCARLPYGLKVKLGDNPNIFDLEYRIKFAVMYGDSDKLEDILDITNIKPYLFPISSMTEEQWREITDIQIQESLKSLDSIDDNITNPLFSTDDLKTIEWCYANYIDIHDLIPMGLALDATGKGIY